jgi:quinoprotein glucose dehydrogenase
MDHYLRAFDVSNGAELWRGRLSAPAMATPMTYAWQGKQYVVVYAGGNARSGTALSDQLIAFALPAAHQAR